MLTLLAPLIVGKVGWCGAAACTERGGWAVAAARVGGGGLGEEVESE